MHSEELVAVEDVLEPIYHSVDSLSDSLDMLVDDLHFFGLGIPSHGLVSISWLGRRGSGLIWVSHSPYSYNESRSNWKADWPNTKIVEAGWASWTVWIRKWMIPRHANVDNP